MKFNEKLYNIITFIIKILIKIILLINKVGITKLHHIVHIINNIIIYLRSFFK